MIGVDAPYITTDEDADQQFGKNSEFGGRVKRALDAAREADRTGVVFVAGICSRCGEACTAQWVTMHVNTPGKNEALCSGCLSKDAEKLRADWFAAEERAAR